MELRRAIASVREVAGVIGPWRALALAPLWGLVQRYELFGTPIEPTPRAVPASGFPQSELTPADTEALAAANPRLPRTEIERRLAEGQRCGLWWSADRVAHYRWIATGPATLPFAPLEFHPAAGDLLTQETFTPPEFRRRGLQSVSSAWSDSVAREMGLRRRLAFVAWWNTPPLVVARRNYRTLGALSLWRLGPRLLFRGTGAVRIGGRVVTVA